MIKNLFKVEVKEPPFLSRFSSTFILLCLQALMKSTSLTSLKSQGGASLVLESGKETEV